MTGRLGGLNAATAHRADETAIIRIDGMPGANRDGHVVQTLVTERLQDRLCWVASRGWLRYRDGFWEDVSDANVVEVTRRYILRKIQSEAAAGHEGSVSMWADYLKRSDMGNLVALARGVVERVITDFDRDPHLLNCLNGTVDLRTGALLEHNPGWLITKTTGVNYRADATSRDWDKALEALPEDKRDYLRDRLGQAISGEMTPDDVLLVQQGGGENGKTTVMFGVCQAIGMYHTFLSDRTLMANPNAHPTELMDLQGVRMALVEETPEERQLNVKRLKDTVGTPIVKARRMRKDPVEFPATHSLFLNTNYPLVVMETDHGTWRRLVLLVWPYRFRKEGERLENDTDRRGDDGLRGRIRDDPAVHEAALAWLVGAAVEWYKRDKKMLPTPDSVKHETDEWRAQCDAVWSYSEEHLVFELGVNIPAADMLMHFNTVISARFNGLVWSSQQLKDRFATHDAVPRSVVNKAVRVASSRLSRPCDSGLLLEPIKAQTVKAYTNVRFKTPAEREEEELTRV